MPIGSLKSVNNMALKQLRITANINTANFQQVSVRSQVTIQNITGNFKTYNVFNNGTQVATNVSSSSYTMTGLSDNVQIGPITIVPYYGNNIPGNTFTVTGGSGGGKIYTPSYLTSLTTSSIGCYRATINMVGSWSNLYITYSGGTASPSSGFNTTANIYTFTSMSSNTTYTFNVQSINGDGITSTQTLSANALTAYYTLSPASGTTILGSTAGYNWIFCTNSTTTITFFNQSFYGEILMIAGGGGGGSNSQVNGAGGGGGGGIGIGNLYIAAGLGSKMAVGGGAGRITANRGNTGGQSTIVGGTGTNISLYVQGGGGGGGYNGATVTYATGSSGGSGGGAGYSTATRTGSAALVPPGGGNLVSGYGTMTFYGNRGGDSAVTGGGGGGGATVQGAAGNGYSAGNGGDGIGWYLNGTLVFACGGGGGGVGKYGVGGNGTCPFGGGGGGGANGSATNGSSGTGGGGGGGNNNGSGGGGGYGGVWIAFY